MSTQTSNNVDIIRGPLGECTVNNVTLRQYTASSMVNSDVKDENACVSQAYSSIRDMNDKPNNSSGASGKAKKKSLKNKKSKNGHDLIGSIGLTDDSAVMADPSFGETSDISKLASTDNAPSENTDATTAEVTPYPIEAFAKITKHNDLKKTVPAPGSPLLVAKAPLRQKSKSHKPVKKAVRDSKHGNPMLRIKARADQLKAKRKNIADLDDVSCDHTSEDASDATTSEDSSLYNGEQRMISYTFHEKNQADFDDGDDGGVQVDSSSISMQNMELHGVSKDHSSQLRSDKDAETIVDSEPCSSIKKTEEIAPRDTIVPKMSDEFGHAAIIECASIITVSKKVIDTPTTPLGLLAIPNSSEYPGQLSRETQEELVSTYVHPFLGGTPITPARLLRLPNREQYLSAISREMQQTLVNIHVTGAPIVYIQPDTPRICAMLKDVSTIPEIEDITVIKVESSQNSGSSVSSEPSTTEALEQTPSFLVRPKVDDTLLSQNLDNQTHPAIASESQSGPAVNSLEVYKLRNTYLGIISLEDFIEQLDFSKNNTVTKQDICVAFATLSAKESRAFGFDGFHLTTDDVTEEYRSPFIQHQIKLGGSTLHAFLVSIHFQLDWTVNIQEVAAAFRRLSKQDSVGPSPKVIAFLQLEAAA